MRIVGGKFRGRAIASPQHEGLRPTSDRVREAVFNILEHGIEGGDVAGKRVIDLFAGTGALGLEAVSRGAEYCLFVEDAAEARALIRTNIEALALMGVTRMFRRDATDLGPAGNMEAYAIAFLDPPYAKGLGEKGLIALRDGKWLTPSAIAVLEERDGVPVDIPEGFTEVDRRTWSDTQVLFLRFEAR